MIASLVAALSVAVPATASATVPAYTRLELCELALRADAAVVGTIRDVDAETFTVVVGASWFGRTGPSGSELTVRRFENWMCAGRWTAYAPDQRLVLFLGLEAERSRAGRSAAWSSLGAGNEGELPIVDGRAIVEASHGYAVQGFELREHEAFGATIRGSAVPIGELERAVVELRRRLWVAHGAGGSDWSHGPTRDARLDELRSESRIARHVVDEARSSADWRGLSLDEARRLSAGERRSFRHEDLGWPPDSGLGASVAFVAELDAEGRTRLALGLPFLRDRAGGVGFVRASRATVEHEDATIESWAPTPLDRLDGIGWGYGVAALGDLDRDARPEILVAPLRDGGPCALLLELAGDGRPASGVELDATRWPGLDASPPACAAFDRAPDPTSDGRVDVAIGQGYSGSPGTPVFVGRLDARGSIDRLVRIDDPTHPMRWDASFGTAVAWVGDVDGDGTIDLAVGDDSCDDGGRWRGCVWIVFLNPDVSVRRYQKISDWTGGFEGPLVDESGFGGALAGVGDLDHDGVPDLVVGSRARIWTLFLARDGTVREHRSLSLVESGALVGATSLAVLPGERPLVAVGNRGVGIDLLTFDAASNLVPWR